jgi:hypothetical protein
VARLRGGTGAMAQPGVVGTEAAEATRTAGGLTQATGYA